MTDRLILVTLGRWQGCTGQQGMQLKTPWHHAPRARMGRDRRETRYACGVVLGWGTEAAHETSEHAAWACEVAAGCMHAAWAQLAHTPCGASERDGVMLRNVGYACRLPECIQIQAISHE
jgi:hypothetical protein